MPAFLMAIIAKFTGGTSVAKITSNLKTLVTSLEHHAASKIEEVAAHAAAEAKAIEAKVAASKEVDAAKAVAAKIEALISA